jgi:putative transposase
MKRSRFSEEQIIGMLKEQEVGAKLAELGRRHGISETTFLRTWRQKVVTPAHARTSHGISERRAGSIIEVDQNPVRCRSRRGDDADLRCRRRELAAEWRRFGYRRLGLLLAREGFVVNRKKLLRLYREEGSEGAAAASGRWARERQSPRRNLRTNDGRWTSRAMR